MKPNSQPIALSVRFEASGAFCHVTARVCAVKLESDGTPDWARYISPFHRICFTSQSDADRDDGVYYSQRIEWQPDYSSGLTLREAEDAIAALRHIEKRMEKMRETEGAFDSVGAHLNRLARAIGATTIYIHSYSPAEGNRYIPWNPGEAVSVINDRARALCARIKPAKEQS